MDRKGTSFSLTVDTEIFNQGIHPSIIIYEDDITITEQNDLLYLDSIKNEIFPYTNIFQLLGSAHGNSQRYKRTGKISWDIEQFGTLSDSIDFTEARFIIKVD